MAKAKYPHPFLTNIDDAISQAVPKSVELEAQAGIPKTYVVLGVATVLFMLIFFNVGAAFFVNIIGLVFPAFAAFSTLELPASEQKNDDLAHWLTYFVIFSFLTIVEYFQKALLYWLPFYYLLKVLALVYLMLPATKGALTVYKTIIHPQLAKLNPKTTEKVAKAQ